MIMITDPIDNVPNVLEHPEYDEFGCLSIKSLYSGLSFMAPREFGNNCFSLTLAINAYGRYTTKTDTVDIIPGSIFFSSPNKERLLEWHNMTEVYHIIFSERFLLKYAGVALFNTFPFLVLDTAAAIHANPEIVEELSKIYLQIEQEYSGGSPFKKNIIANLLTRILLKIKQNFWQDYNSRNNEDKEHDIVMQFINNLEHYSQQLQLGKASVQLRVKDFAKMQHIHENYLYNVVKQRTGKMVSHWIIEKKVLIAKSLLEDSLFSIKEIAYRLGFTYISYFTIFFKKHTGFTPKVFRKNSSA